jgi:tRNA (guanosine-2'-O-)-methyltransferase
MSHSGKWTQFARLVEDCVLSEEDRPFWQLLRPERAALLLGVLGQRTNHITVAVEAIYHGHNQAAVLRTADAFGVQSVTIAEGRNEFEPNLDITQGAHKWLTLHRHRTVQEAVADLHKRGYQVWASRLDPSSVPLDQVDLSHPAAFLFGNERDGLSPEALHLADETFVVPMVGFAQSLNISVAAAVTLFHATHRSRAIMGERYYLTRDQRRQILRHWLRIAGPNSQRMAVALSDWTALPPE